VSRPAQSSVLKPRVRSPFARYKEHPHYWDDIESALAAHPYPAGKSESAKFHALDGPVPVAEKAPASPEKKAEGEKPMRLLIFGKTGWLGGLLGKICEKQGLEWK
jgi:hypothetical protein